MAKVARDSLYFLANVRGNSWFHRLDPRTKVVYLLAVVAVDLLFLQPLYLLGVFLTTLPVWITSRIRLKPILPQLMGFGLTLLSFMVFIFSMSGAVGMSGHVTQNQTRIDVGPLAIYPGALSIGLVQVLRMAIPMVTSLLVFATTDPSSFARALYKMKVPREISFMLVTALRFFPLAVEESHNVTQAQKVRGVSTKGPRNRLRATRLMVLPLFINLLRESRDMGIAVESRGFGAKKWKGSFKELEFKTNDYLVFAWIVVLVCAAIFIRFVLGLGWSWII